MPERTTIAARLSSKWMRTFTFAVGAAAMVWLSAGPTGAQSDLKVAWSPNLLLRSVDDIPQRLREPEGSKRLRLAKGKESLEAGNCEGYLNAVSAGFAPATNYDNEMSFPFVHDCFVLRDLEHARAATSSASYRFTPDSLTQLPPLLVRGAREITDAAEQAEKRGESWKQFDPSLKVARIDSDSLNAEDKDTLYFLTFRARGDFNGDGVEDIAVFGSANGTHGSWSLAEYMILSATSDGKLVRLTDRRAPYGIKAIQRGENH
jgi:hypothetical protein